MRLRNPVWDYSSIQAILLIVALCGCVAREEPTDDLGRYQGQAMRVQHEPFPVEEVPDALLEELREFDYAYASFYRTKVKNQSDRPIRIIWFDSYITHDSGDHWWAENVRGETLRTDTFTEWYGGDGLTKDGWLKPGATAVCEINWDAAREEELADYLVKWAYIGVDRVGHDYFSEAIVPEAAVHQLEEPDE